MIKTDENSNISVEFQLICTESSEQGLFLQAGQNESKELYAMIKTDKNSNISVESRLICTEPFQGVYIKLWSCNICHKKCSPDFQLFISGGGCYIKLWPCEICHKKFLPDFQHFISRGGGGWGGGW